MQVLAVIGKLSRKPASVFSPIIWSWALHFQAMANWKLGAIKKSRLGAHRRQHRVGWVVLGIVLGVGLAVNSEEVQAVHYRSKEWPMLRVAFLAHRPPEKGADSWGIRAKLRDVGAQSWETKHFACAVTQGLKLGFGCFLLWDTLQGGDCGGSVR